LAFGAGSLPRDLKSVLGLGLYTWGFPTALVNVIKRSITKERDAVLLDQTSSSSIDREEAESSPLILPANP